MEEQAGRVPDDLNTFVGHLFRRQAGQLISTLTRIFGSEHLDLAEGVVQEAFLRACEQWPDGGVPDNPAGWVTTVAKNRALDVLRRQQRLAGKEEALTAWYAGYAGPGGSTSPGSERSR